MIWLCIILCVISLIFWIFSFKKSFAFEEEQIEVLKDKGYIKAINDLHDLVYKESILIPEELIERLLTPLSDKYLKEKDLMR